MLFAHGTFFESVIFWVCNSFEAWDNRLQPLMFSLFILKLQDAIMHPGDCNWMDHCDQVSVQVKEDNFLMEENMFRKNNWNYFQ